MNVSDRQPGYVTLLPRAKQSFDQNLMQLVQDERQATNDLQTNLLGVRMVVSCKLTPKEY